MKKKSQKEQLNIDSVTENNFNKDTHKKGREGREIRVEEGSARTRVSSSISIRLG
jgi:hypothetical protein